METLKALSDPVRLRILETMVQAADEDWTVKRIATALGVGPTKLYHHIAILEERELIRVAGTRVVSGIIETRYRIAQLSVRLDRTLLSRRSRPTRRPPRSRRCSGRSSTRPATTSDGPCGAGRCMLDAGAEPLARGILRQDLKRL